MSADSVPLNRPQVKRSGPVIVFLNAFIIGLVALTWCLATQFSKTALNFDIQHFNAPYFMMWFNSNFLMTCFPAFLIYERIRSGKQFSKIIKESKKSFLDYKGLNFLTLVKFVIPFLIFNILANYPYVRALLLITPSVATSISACNAAFVYILGIIVLHDSIHIMKIVSVLLAIGGVVVTSLDSELRVQWLGIVLATVSAFMAAVYKVLFKKMIGNATLGDVSLFMTSLGFLNLILNWIPSLILILTGVELFNINYAPWVPMLGAAFLSMLFNFTINFGVAILNPLTISVGMLCGIPLNTGIDILFRGVHATTFFIIGTSLIMASFLLIIIPYDKFKSSNKSKEKIALERL